MVCSRRTGCYFLSSTYRRKRTVLRHLSSLGSGSTWPNDEILACRLDHFFRDHLEFVRQQYMLYLEHKPINQTEVSTGYAHNRGNRLFVGKIIGMRLAPMAPALTQEIVHFLLG